MKEIDLIIKKQQQKKK